MPLRLDTSPEAESEDVSEEKSTASAWHALTRPAYPAQTCDTSTSAPHRCCLRRTEGCVGTGHACRSVENQCGKSCHSGPYRKLSTTSHGFSSGSAGTACPEGRTVESTLR